MIQRDFILRLIEQLGAAARALISGGSETGPPNEGLAALNETCEQGLGLTFAVIASMPPSDLLELFRAGGGTFPSRTALAGSVFALHAKLAETGGDPDRGSVSRQKALFLFEQLRGYPDCWSDYKIEEQMRG